MGSAQERLYRVLLLDPKRAWRQTELAARADCTRGYVSRVVNSLVAAGVLGRPYRTRVVLTGPAKLLTLWAARRRLPSPRFVTTSRTPEAVDAILASHEGVALTLFRAAWHRTKFMATASVEAYVSRDDLPGVAAQLGQPTSEPTAVSLYPTDGAELEGRESIGGLPLVSVAQNVVDLMAFGGQGPRVAIQLARTYGLWEA